MQKLLVAALLATGLITTPAMAADTAESKSIPAYVVGATIQAEAEVMAIDLPSRKVTLKLEDGTVTDFVVGKEARNLPQVKVGDRVAAKYDRALMLKLKKGPGLRVTEENSGAARTAAGEKPGVAVASEVNFVADVTKVNAKAKQITIKGAKGKEYTLDVKDADLFSQIKVGDQVEGTYQQVLAIAVLTPAGK